MEKEFVTYEIALSLKELGFGIIGEYIQLPYYYDLKGNLIINHIGVRRKNKPYQIGANTIDDFEAYLSITDNSSEDFVLAPLYQQAFRWFRAKHNLDSWIYCHNKSKVYFAIILKDKRFVSYNEKFDTYEEAESACLNKLIEIVKNGNNS